MTEDKKRACDKCHEIKQACSGEIPCDRCKRRSLSCTVRRPPKKMGRPAIRKSETANSINSLSPSSPRQFATHLRQLSFSDILNVASDAGVNGNGNGNGDVGDVLVGENPPKRNYSRDGCLACRKRKKKCENETWPCKMCLRMGLECSGPITPKRKPRRRSSSSSTSSCLLVENTLTTPPHLMVDPRCLSKKPVKSGQFDNTTTDEMFLAIYNVDTGTLEFTMDLLVQQVNLCDDLGDVEKFYLRYFITDVSPVLFAKSHAHVFLKEVVPLGLKSRKIRDPLLGIAATHRSCSFSQACGGAPKSSGGTGRSALRDFNIFRSRAKLMEIDSSNDSDSLLSVLLIVTMEILIGDSLDWFVLLGKANAIVERYGGIRNMIRNKQEKDDLRLIVIQLFCYLDLVSSLSTCNPPYVEIQQMGGAEDNANPCSPDYVGVIDTDTSQVLKTEMGFKFGIAGGIFNIMGKISTLSSLRNLRHKDPDYETQFNRFAQRIEMELQNWTVPEEVRFENISDFQRTQYAVALQWACFLRLHQIRYGYNRDDSRPRSCLTSIVQAIQAIPEGSPLECGLMVPLILAGSVTSTEEDREFILRRMSNIRKQLQFPYVGQFENLLRNIWNRDDKEANLVNWAAVRYYEYPGLVMF